MKNLVKISILIGVFSLAFFSVSPAHAFTCGERSVIGNSPPYWGTEAGKNVSASKGSQVRISIKGEDGCAGQTTTFTVYKAGTIVKSFDVTLSAGAAVSGQTGAFILSADVINDLDNGDYTVKLLKVGSQVISSSESSNALSVQSAQACNLSKVYPSPNGGQPGNQIQLIAEALGTCQGWQASINVIDDFTGSNQAVVFTGSGQDISSGKAIWNWTLPATPAGAAQAPFHLVAHLGNQNLASNPFLDTRAPCVAGTCTLAPNVPAPVPATGGKNYFFNITNPLNGGPNDLFDIIDVVTKLLLQLSIPIAVLLILYAGFLMLTAGPVPANFEKGKKILTQVVIGLAIIFIGRGFITLIISIIELGDTGTTTSQNSGTTNSQDQNAPLLGPNLAGLGVACSPSIKCATGLICNQICQRSGGNAGGEACQSSSNPSNCKSNSCSVISGSLDGTCVDNPTSAGTSGATQQYRDIFTIVSAQTAGGTVNAPYSVTLRVTNPADSSATINWAVVDGSLPYGTTLDGAGTTGTGSIHGTPTKAGKYNVTVQGMDIANKLYGRLKLTLEIK